MSNDSKQRELKECKDKVIFLLEDMKNEDQVELLLSVVTEDDSDRLRTIKLQKEFVDSLPTWKP